jgi:hypothetical protein
MSWQPIKTAPKDGTGFLYFIQPVPSFPDFIAIGAGHFSDGVYRAVDFFSDGPGPIIEPTHWMPLPAPPAAAQEE